MDCCEKNMRIRDYYACFVPRCHNTSLRTPEKHFFFVPKNEAVRATWYRAANCNLDPKKKTSRYFCQDHFKMPEDTCNFYQRKSKNFRLRLKSNVVPYIFPCQGQFNITESRTRDVDKRNSEEDDAEADNTVAMVESADLRIAEGDGEAGYDVAAVGSAGLRIAEEDGEAGYDVAAVGSDSVRIAYAESYSLTSSSSSAPIAGSSDPDFDGMLLSLKSTYLSNTMALMKREPQFYTGVPPECFDKLCQVLEENLHLCIRDIFLVLRKIRLNEQMVALGHSFEISASSVSRIITKTLPILRDGMSYFVPKLKPANVRKHLPLEFRYRYSKTYYVIDCFEIKMEKASDALKQSLSWSEYKTSNTIKYLIASTPDRVINFISKGFGGRISDAALVQQSGFLDCLEPGTSVMADRSFKGIDQLLQERNCFLVRPPSVLTGQTPTDEEVEKTRSVASCRIIVENVIGNLRNFKMLEHKVDIQMLEKVDDVVFIACALCNLQGTA